MQEIHGYWIKWICSFQWHTRNRALWCWVLSPRKGSCLPLHFFLMSPLFAINSVSLDRGVLHRFLWPSSKGVRANEDLSPRGCLYVYICAMRVIVTVQLGQVQKKPSWLPYSYLGLIRPCKGLVIILKQISQSNILQAVNFQEVGRAVQIVGFSRWTCLAFCQCQGGIRLTIANIRVVECFCPQNISSLLHRLTQHLGWFCELKLAIGMFCWGDPQTISCLCWLLVLKRRTG